MITTIEKYRKRKKRKLKKDNKNNKHQNSELFPVVELPEEVIFSDILTRLPVNSLTRFKLVSKTWNSLISTPQFIKSHLRQTVINPYVSSKCVFIRSPYYFYILNYGAYDGNDQRGEKGLVHVKNMSFYDNGVNTFLIGSCHGLVCFGRGSASNGYNYCFHVYNPVMGQFVHVLDPLGNFHWKLICGFGFVGSRDDYVLFVAGLQKRCNETFVYVYSLRAKMWRKIGVFDEDKLAIFSGGRGVLVNETLHWDMTQVLTPNVKSVCGFDLVDESFKDVRVPDALLGNGHHWDFKLCEIGGCLGVWGGDMNGGVQMWKLVQYGVWDSWMMLFKIDFVPGLRDFCGYTDNGKVLLQKDNGSLLLADPNQSSWEYTSVVKDMGDIEVVSYVRSPVSPFL